MGLFYSYMKKTPLTLILPIIVIAQFCCTSLWFAGNGVLENLVAFFNLSNNVVGVLTSAVQFGFITGTLVFAVLTISDRFSPSKVFLVSAILGGLFNIAMIWEGNSFYTILLSRFLTGFFLAGIYPVGMKIAADYFKEGLGKSLGYLVGALVLGTALPHLLNGLATDYSFKAVLVFISCLSVLGGLLVFFLVPNGPYRKPSQKLNFLTFFSVFKGAKFRAAAFGYFGHMWELYAFWAFVPIMLTTYNRLYPEAAINVSFISFIVIAVGALSCIAAGYLSQRFGAKKVAFMALLLSGLCCLCSPMFFMVSNHLGFIALLLFWGMMVIADSPLFSTMVAHNTSAQTKGTALIIVNCIGFAITIVSIQLLSYLTDFTGATNLYVLLAIGPILGLFALAAKTKHKAA